ncbi:hypothetical protein C4556_00555 [Candidatus Parcubacteria bacterium]|nr:MAG: hypothetical protein C4556_00555 [Candidatus Parcubacteria bacterium]
MLGILLNIGIGICALGLLWSLFQIQRYRYMRKLLSELPPMQWFTFDEVVSSYECPAFFARIVLSHFADKKIAETKIAHETPDKVKRWLLSEISVRPSTAPYYEYRILKKYPRRPRRVRREEVNEAEWNGLPVPA